MTLPCVLSSMAPDMSKRIFLRSLGESTIETPSSVISPNQEVLFAAGLFIALNSGRRVSRDAIETALWPELHNSPGAHHRLRQTVLKLKEAGFPIRRERGYLISAVPIVTDFEEILSTPKENDLPVLPASFELLPDYVPKLSVEYAHWLDEKRIEINASLVRILLEHIHYARNRGEWARVESLTRTCCLVDPYNEEAILARAESVALRGGKIEALALLDDYVAELGAAPSEMRIPANLMRGRISERQNHTTYEAPDVPLIGRAAALLELNTALETTMSGHGKCVLIEGEVGMGKSRLLTEFADFAQLKGHEVKYLRAQQSDRTRPLSLFVELVPSLRQLRGAIGCAPSSIESLDRLTSDSSRNPLYAKLTDPITIAEHLLAAILDLLDAVCEESTVVLIVDDAQWLDVASLTLFEAIAGWASKRKLLLVFAARSAFMDSKSLRTAFTSVVGLEALTHSDSVALVHGLLRERRDLVDETTVQRIVTVGEGNPFFLKELVRQWEETGRQDQSPPSIVAITNQRLQRLSRPALQILQTCAILGRFSTFERLEKILEFKTFELIDGLDELGKAVMVRTEKLRGEHATEPQIICAHELIGSAALKLLAAPARIAMHRRVGWILEEESTKEFSPSLVAESAMHWEKAGDSKHACRLTTSYADYLMAIGFPSDAIHVYKSALTLSATPEQKSTILGQLISSLYAAGEWREVGEAISTLRELQRMTGANLFDHSDIELIAYEAKWRSSTEWSDLLSQVKRCIFAETATAHHRVRAAVLGLKLATNVGTSDELDQIYFAVERLLQDSTVDQSARLYVEMVYHIDRGEIERGQKAALSLVETERAKGSSANLVWSLVNASQAMRRCGDLNTAISYLEEAFDLTRSKNLPTRACTVAHHLILTALAKDDLVNAQKWLDTARLFSTPTEDLHTQHELLYYGARVALKTGNLEEASRLTERIVVSQDQSLLRRISLLALNLRLAVESRASIAQVKQLLPPFLALYELECARGGQDFEAYALFLARCYVGQSETGITQLMDYVNIFRRERGEPSREILEALQSHASTGD